MATEAGDCFGLEGLGAFAERALGFRAWRGACFGLEGLRALIGGLGS